MPVQMLVAVWSTVGAAAAGDEVVGEQCRRRPVRRRGDCCVVGEH